MTERERLIELLNKQSCPSPLLCDKNCKYSHLESCYAERVADHLLANGVIVPPGKVGDFLYKPKKIASKLVVVEYVITAIMSIEKDEWIIRYRKDRGHTHHQCSIDDIGETVFLTKEEAVQAKGGAE